jgi:hypothetical protein
MTEKKTTDNKRFSEIGVEAIARNLAASFDRW